MKLLSNLAVQIAIAMILGVVVGLFLIILGQSLLKGVCIGELGPDLKAHQGA